MHALSTYVVGLSLTAPAGSKWQLAPQFGDLSSAEGGFTTPLGIFSSGWNLTGSEYSLWYMVPTGTTGSIITPGSQASVVMDGSTRALGIAEFDKVSKTVTMTVQGDGKRHHLTIAL